MALGLLSTAQEVVCLWITAARAMLDLIRQQHLVSRPSCPVHPIPASSCILTNLLVYIDFVTPARFPPSRSLCGEQMESKDMGRKSIVRSPNVLSTYLYMVFWRCSSTVFREVFVMIATVGCVVQFINRYGESDFQFSAILLLNLFPI